MTEQSQQQLTHNQSTLLQSTPILSTKLYIPPARENAIARPLLVERLLHGVERPGNFILISGPAGFGKTTLLSEFAGRCMQPTTWVSLDESDNDLIRFWTYLITACQSILGDVGESALELLSTAQQLPDDTIPTILINDFAMQDRSIVLVLDDYHNIQNSSIHGSLQFLLDHLPHNFHIIVSTRIDPPWPLVRYRARNQLTEIRAQDLRFSIVEAAEFLTCTMGLDLSDKDVAILEERTEGWIAGLQLAALSIEGRSDVADFIRAFTGSHLFIAEYLIIEILQKQPEDCQLFLLQTSILERMNSGLCEAVTDCPDGQAILNDLHRANIFLIPLDNEGHWFRYHHLFADLLLARLRHDLSGAATAELHMRASDWYAQNGFTLEAVNHALAASDFKRAAALVDQAGQTMILTDKYSVLNNWLGALPKEAFQTYPRLEIYQVLIDLNLAKLDMSEHTLNEKERLINALPPSPENDRLRLAAMVYLSLFLAFQNSSRAIRIAKDALAEIPETDLKLRAFLFSALYRAYGMEGNRERSAPAYRECLRLAEAAGQYGMVANTTMIRAFDLCQYGRLDEATRYCQLIIDAGKRLGRKVFYPAGTAYIGLAGIHLERNDLQLAEDYLKRGLELCRQGGTFGLFTGYAQKSRLHQAKGEFDEALAQLQFIEQTFQRREFTLVARQVSIRLAMNDVASASLMVPALLEILGGSPFAYQLPLVAVESIKLSLSRIYIAQGLIEQALQALDEIEGTVERDKRFGRLMEVYLLRALAEQKEQAQNVTCKAKRYLEEALDLAEPVGFILLFVEEGPALIPLLNAVVDDRDTPNRLKKYAQKLQNAFADFGKPEVLNRPGIADGLVESLTPREMEILQLIATGDSNQEIADELVITVRTVKKHISNILGKLDANNRTQAVALARDHGLISSEK